MSAPSDKVAKWYDNLGQQILSRAIRGECNYAQDMPQLQVMLSKVQELQVESVELSLLNVIAVVSSVSGYFSEAAAHFRTVYERSVLTNNLNGMITALNNQALTLDMLGKQAESLQVYNEGMQILVGTPQPHHRIRSYGLLVTGRMGLLLVFDQLEEAEQSFNAVQQVADSFVNFNREEYARTMLYGYHHMAEIALQRGQIDEALTYYGLAVELAKGGNMQLEMGPIEFTRAHIETVRQEPDTAAAYWEKGAAGVESINIPAMRGVQFMSEAHYLRRKGISQWMEHFARRALAVFEQHGIEQGQNLIHEQLHIQGASQNE